MFRQVVILLFVVLSGNSLFGQEKFIVKKDLKDQWRAFSNNSYTSIDGSASGLRSIHFSLDTRQFPGNFLQVRSGKEFFVFMNGKLLKEHEGVLNLPLDSLEQIAHGAALNFSIYQNRIHGKDLQTFIISHADTEKQLQNAPKPASFFKDFVTIAGLALIVFFVVIIRLHPKLAADYFSVTRILSLREAEDNQSHARFAISSNVLFYVFSSLLLALCLIILFYHLPTDYLLPLDFKASSFGGIALQWLKLSIIILVILFSKILIIFLLSNLFGMRGIAGIHFFNWIRLLLIISGGLSAILFVYYISRGTNEDVYVTMLSVIVAALVGWIIIVFLKLNNRIEHSMFHLFSYICATEVIPLLITIKVLFN